MTGVGIIVAIIAAIYNSFLFTVDWIEESYYVKTKDDSIFDSKENPSH